MKRLLLVAVAVNLANAVLALFMQELHAVFGWLTATAFTLTALFLHEKNDTYPFITDEEKLK